MNKRSRVTHKVIHIEPTAEGPARVRPPQRIVNVSFPLDEDLAQELFAGMPFERLSGPDRIRRLAPILWDQLKRELDRWQARPGGSLDPRPPK